MNCRRLRHSQTLLNCTPSFIWDKELWHPAGKHACSNNLSSHLQMQKAVSLPCLTCHSTQLPCCPLHTLALRLTWLMLAELEKLCHFSFNSKALFWSAKNFLDWKKYALYLHRAAWNVTDCCHIPSQAPRWSQCWRICWAAIQLAVASSEQQWNGKKQPWLCESWYRCSDFSYCSYSMRLQSINHICSYT